ncbi:hypothetical protein A2U01_0064459, partial [Trifolium medium]|nr:hypothetical protein [Trifolium medium]
MRLKQNLEKNVVAFWDYESCPVPNEVDTSGLQSIFLSSLEMGNFTENISVEVFGVMDNVAFDEIQAVLRTGIFRVTGDVTR